jgi:hypothetical protein
MRHLQDRWGVGDEYPTGSQRLHRMRNDPPRLGQVEHHAVDTTFVDALVAIP